MLGTGGLESRDSRTSQNADELGDAGADPEAARGVQGCGRWAPRGRPEQKVQNRAVYRTVVRQDGIKADSKEAYGFDKNAGKGNDDAEKKEALVSKS